MLCQPKFLNASRVEQRSRFREISAYCEDHLAEALDPQAGGSPWSVNAALEPRNRSRNRYSNVLPWDKTRVRLACSKDGSDYINASWVQLQGNKYIASQGPVRNTVHHFWAMCFSQAVKSNSLAVLIAMVTPLVEQGREKCYQYWPTKHEGAWDLGAALRAESIEPEDLKIKWLSEDASDGIVLTRLELASRGVVKTVYHYLYLGWADTQTPDSVLPLLMLSRHISTVKEANPELVPIVHCSAGVGRTGTFIAIDHFLNSKRTENPHKDMVFETVKSLRDHRMMMVQTVHQYSFLYKVARDIYEAKFC